MAQNAVNRSRNVDIFPNNIDIDETTASGDRGVISMFEPNLGDYVKFIHAGDASQTVRSVFIGGNAGTIGEPGDHIGIGRDCMTNLDGGSRNIAIGETAFENITSGDENVGIGADVAKSISTGSRNIVVGKPSSGFAGDGIFSGTSDVIAIKNNGGTTNGDIFIGNSTDNSRCFIAGMYNTSSGTTPREALIVDSANQVGTNTNLVGDYQANSGTTMSVGQGYIADNGASTAVFTLPSSPSVGDVIHVVGRDSGGWQINQNSGDTIHRGSASSTTGTGGSLASTNQWTSVKIMHVGSGDWLIIATDGSGSLTLT